MKRITNWPQFVLGLAFAWGALVGWSATIGSLGWPPLALYAGAILWTMGYDTIYALQDIVDDAVVGIGSTAIQFGAHVRGGVASLYGLAVVACGTALVGVGAGPWCRPAGSSDPFAAVFHMKHRRERVEAAKLADATVACEPRFRGFSSSRRPISASVGAERHRTSWRARRRNPDPARNTRWLASSLRFPQ